MSGAPPIPPAPGRDRAAGGPPPPVPGDEGRYAYDVARSDPRGPGSLGEGPAAPARARRPWVRRAAWIGGFALLALIAAGVSVYVAVKIGPGTALVAFTTALVPVAIVLAAVWWLDRYTPQPRSTLLFAFGWGAAMSVALALVIGTVVELTLIGEDTEADVAQFLGAVVQAPIVEESMKSAGLLVLLLFGRRYISGPLDGVVYAVLIAGGFAFTENILYFGQAFAQSQAAGETSAFWQTFLMRGLMSPFAHAGFTSLAGLGIGIAAERRSLPLYIGLGIGGLSLGMCLHALWNGATFFIDVDPEEPLRGFLTYYAIVQIPIFLILAAIMAWLRWRERTIVRRQLSAYGRAGWFTPDEVTMMLSMRSRRRAEAWAARHGANARTAMRDLIRAAVQLAMDRNSARHARRRTERIRRDERDLLERITSDRRLIDALTRPVARPAPAGAPTDTPERVAS
ncbi:PrsW family intramembrane metalloprotease [Brachybacterium huguangmaarense]|uniref:PrsW family intramembrane metalloprotease n=1 Tax=Brachybacterium huguangmaarense TaxID=1652028 RepID=A0ABY6G094_9MICO|nr:PrsW family intramembrane metalloprotease [Brachybacterium huguangmaarense]UYG16532.1 PrsW family intramembrane metalloprotease [Brachybacterium huguangmaarense]